MILAIVIPAYNEEKTIGSIVSSLKNYGIVIVVNDRSSDKTATIANDAGAVVITHENQLGYDGALNSGFKKALELKATHVITFDADGQHPVGLIKDFIKSFNEGFELILGARKSHQRFSEYLFSYYTNTKFGITDPLCGMKGYSISLLKEQGYFDSYKSIGTELALRCLTRGKKYKEIPFMASLRIDGPPRFSSTIRANYKILRALYKSVFIR